MKTKHLIIYLMVAIAIISGGLVLITKNNDPSTSQTSQKQSLENNTSERAIMPAPETEEQKNSQLLKDFVIAKHDTANDCWTIIDGTVYDITDYIPSHPGANSILLACGGDGTSLFKNRTNQTGERVGSGTPHSGGASSILSDFKIGTLDTKSE